MSETSEATLKRARVIATSACEDYGEFDDAGWDKFTKSGIWNDHPSVQAAIMALKETRTEHYEITEEDVKLAMANHDAGDQFTPEERMNAALHTLMQRLSS